MLPQKLRYRLASQLHDAWRNRTRQSAEHDCGWCRVSECFEEMQEARRRLDKARRAKLILILPELDTELAARLRFMQDALCLRATQRKTTQPPVPTLSP